MFGKYNVTQTQTPSQSTSQLGSQNRFKQVFRNPVNSTPHHPSSNTNAPKTIGSKTLFNFGKQKKEIITPPEAPVLPPKPPGWPKQAAKLVGNGSKAVYQDLKDNGPEYLRGAATAYAFVKITQ